MKKIKGVLLVLICCGTQIISAQNVGINSTGTTPNSSSILDLNAGNTFTNPNGKGLIIPNVALTATNAQNPVNTPATSLLVYNTATAGASPNNVIPGYYYWDGAKWVALGGQGSNNWALLGNAGTSVATNFLGTTDNVDLAFRVNNIRSGLIDIANYQTFYGYTAGQNSTAVGILGSFFGYAAGNSNTSGLSNTGIGYNAIFNNQTGGYNTAMGVQTLYNATASNNSALGVNSGFSISSGSNNTALGYYAMNNFPAAAITGNYNTAVGNNAGTNMTSGSYNTLLGHNSYVSTPTFTNATGIGAYSYPGGNDIMVLGSINGVNGAGASAKVGIGTTTPADALVIKVPAASGINCITADVSAGNGNGNALQAISTGNPGYSAIYAYDTPASAGTGFDISVSNHAIAGQDFNNTAYSFAVYGKIFNAPAPSGGVLGYYGANYWGACGYHNTAGTTSYGGYFATSLCNGCAVTGKVNSSSAIEASGVGIGSYGNMLGGWVRGDVYGMAVKGERVSLYVDGKTVVNQPVVELAKTNDTDERTAYYGAVSKNPDVYERGNATLVNGQAIIKLTDTFLKQANPSDITIVVTPMGATQGVYTERKEEGNTFIIKENNNGKSNAKVSWMVIAARNLSDDQKIPNEIKSNSFDANLGSFMHNENDTANPSGNLWWDGSKLNTTAPPAAKQK
jgi:hypothetical protein